MFICLCYIWFQKFQLLLRLENFYLLFNTNIYCFQSNLLDTWSLDEGGCILCTEIIESFCIIHSWLTLNILFYTPGVEGSPTKYRVAQGEYCHLRMTSVAEKLRITSSADGHELKHLYLLLYDGLSSASLVKDENEILFFLSLWQEFWYVLFLSLEDTFKDY